MHAYVPFLSCASFLPYVHSYEDAVNSVKNALKFGILPGGGTTLLYLKRFRDEVVKELKAQDKDDEVFGADILFDALSEPMRQVREKLLLFE